MDESPSIFFAGGKMEVDSTRPLSSLSLFLSLRISRHLREES